MDHEHARAHAPDAAQVVARRPERAPVAGHAVLVLDQVLPDVGTRGDHASGDEVRQHVGVLAEVRVLADSLSPRVGGDDEPVGAVVVVPARDRRHGDDRLQALDAGGGDLVRQRAVVRDAGHADRAGRPVGPHLVAGFVEAAGAAVQPVDHRLGAERLPRAADVRAAVGVEGADALAEHDGVAARHVVVVQLTGEVGAAAGPRAGGRERRRRACRGCPPAA